MKSLFVLFKNLWRNVLRIMKLAFEIDKKNVFLYYLTAIFGAVSPILAAYFFKIAIDAIISVSSVSGVSSVPFLIILVMASYFFMSFIDTAVYWGLNVGYFDYIVRNKFQMGLTYRFNEKMAGLDLGHLENPQIQTLITKVQNTYTWQIPDFLRMWNYIFKDIVGIVVIFFAILPYSFWIPLFVIFMALPRAYFRIKHGNYVWSMFGGSAPEAKKLWYMSDILSYKDSIIESRIFQSKDALLKKLSDLQNHLFEENKKPILKYRFVLVLLPLIESVVTFLLVLFLIPDAFGGAISIGTLTFIISSLEQMRASTAWGATHFGEMVQYSLFVDPYFELMSLPKLVKEKSKPKVFSKIKPLKIEFKNVSFSYVEGVYVLKNVSFTINAGERVALVGVNGAGKSTIVKLLCRFYDVDEGEVLVDGVNIKDLKLSNWYKFLGTLFQDFVKYNFSVRENIMLGNAKIKDEKLMMEAAKKSGSLDFIKTFKSGFDQILGRQFEDGMEISGGQWQKLAIARAFYEKAPILILDEPTSAIDAVSEYEIFQNLNKVYKGKSLILVSHRFSTVRNADKIIVLDKGQILETGSHEELLNMNGKYAKMFRTQAKGYK